MNANRTLIVGNALAGVISALELAEQGQAVTLINPGGPLGGYFAGITIAGHLFDVGLVLLEFDGYAKQANTVADYDPKIRNDVGRFLKLVQDWLLRYSPINEIQMPQMYLANRCYDDVLLSNSYHAFRDLPFADDSVRELKNQPTPALHAREKSVGTQYHTLDYLTASLANHGQHMHEQLIAPFLKKTLGVTADQVLARYHRIPWLPLYYPETLLASFQGLSVPLKPTVFHYPRCGSVASICLQLKQLVEAHPNISYIEQSVLSVKKNTGAWQVQLMDGVCEGAQLVWTGAPAMLVKAFGQTPAKVRETKAAIAVLFLRVNQSDIAHSQSILNVVDLSKATYRVTNQTLCAGQVGSEVNITVEFNQDHFNALYGELASDAEMVTKLLAELASMQLIVADSSPLIAAIKRIPGGFLVPDATARDAWEQDRQTVAELHPEIALLAMSSGFFATSLNDQVIQGLHYAQTRAHQPAMEEVTALV